MNAMHTATPWAEQEMPGGCNDRITADDGEGRTICEFPYGLNADSAFIVKACNAHDDLVAALKEVYAALKKDAADPNTGGDVTVYRLDGGAMYKAINTVRAALAKAGAA